MKIILSLNLCLLILIRICCFSVSAKSNCDDFYNIENWLITSANSGFGTTATPSRGFAELNTDKSKTYGGDASSIHLSTFAQYATVKFNVTPNTEYRLSYKIYYDGEASNNLIISTSGITSLTGTIGFGRNGTYDIITDSKSARCDGGDWTIADAAKDTTATRGTLANFIEGKKWHEINHFFNSGNNTTMVLAIFGRISNENLYVDEFKLSAFEDLGNWGIYHPNNSTQDFVPTPTFDGESCQHEMGWCTISADKYEDADFSGKSIQIKGNDFNVALNLPTLMVNTEYTLSFKYKPSVGTVVGSDNSYFTSRIIKKGTAFADNNMYPVSYIAKLETATKTTDWKELSATFTTDEATDYMLEFHFSFETGYICFLDDFDLTAKSNNTSTVTTAYNNAAAICTANKSSTGKNGLRVYNAISKDFLNNNTVVEYGSIVCCEKFLDEDGLTVSNTNAVKGVAYNSVTQTTPIIYDETDDSYIFTAYLVNIPTSSYGNKYSVRSYAVDEKGRIYYGDTVEVCVFDIAYAIDCGYSLDLSEPTDTDIIAFKVFANFDGNYSAYDFWLANNQKAAGSLRNSEN